LIKARSAQNEGVRELEVRAGDLLQIKGHIGGNSYHAFNKRNERAGLVRISAVEMMHEPSYHLE
jgi:hypothetical protein